MDINMPHMDGLQATEAIMSQNPRPIVIVSSETREGADVTLKALELGAIDFVAKPSGGIDLDMNTVRDELVRKIRMSSKVRVVRTAVRTKLGQEIANSAPRTEPASDLVGRVQSSPTTAAPMASASLNPPRPVSQVGNSLSLDACVRFAACLEISHRRPRRIHGWTGDADEVRSIVPQRFSRGRPSRSTHACEFHRAICVAVAGSLRHARKRSGRRRNVAAGNLLRLPWFTPSAHLSGWTCVAG